MGLGEGGKGLSKGVGEQEGGCQYQPKLIKTKGEGEGKRRVAKMVVTT